MFACLDRTGRGAYGSSCKFAMEARMSDAKLDELIRLQIKTNKLLSEIINDLILVGMVAGKGIVDSAKYKALINLEALFSEKNFDGEGFPSKRT